MKILKNTLFWIATVFLVLAITAVAVPKLFGVEFRAVLTGSMEPDIPVGSLVVVVPTKSDKIEIGDDITFVTASDKVVTHRVIQIDRENNTFTTYGIANGLDNKDAPNKYENIIGVVKLHIPAIGRAFSWISTTSGKIIAITAIAAVYLISALLSVLFGSKKKKQPVCPLPGEYVSEDHTKAYNLTEKPKQTKQKKVKPELTDDFWDGDDDK